MKIALAYYLLFFYAVALFKPVLPVLSDALAHTFSRESHVTTVHRDHGPRHVHTEMANAAASEQDQKSPEIRFSEPVSVHLPCEELCSKAPVARLQKTLFPLLSSSLSAPPLGVEGPPPKALLFFS